MPQLPQVCLRIFRHPPGVLSYSGRVKHQQPSTRVCFSDRRFRIKKIDRLTQNQNSLIELFCLSKRRAKKPFPFLSSQVTSAPAICHADI